MLDKELIALADDVIARRCEMQHVELKAAAKGCPTRLYDTLSSFANQRNGGTIIFGIDQLGYTVCGVYDPQDLQVKVTEQALQMSPAVRPLFTVAAYKGKTIVSAEIAECDPFSKPCFYKGAGRLRGSFIRVGEADLPMTEYEVYSYEAFRAKESGEARVIERAGFDDAIDIAALEKYKEMLKQSKPNLAGLPDRQLCNLQGLFRDEKPTLACLMLFGLYPQAFFPQACITAVAVPGNYLGETGAEGERFADNKRIEGTIPQMLEGALSFVQRNTRQKTIIARDGSRRDLDEYPMIAVRELVLNALIHRDYSIHTETSPIRLMLFNGRLEIENPGGLYGRLTLDALGKVGGDTRNPCIAGTLEVMRITENRFSGIPTIRREAQKRGLREPKFENLRGAFKVTLYAEADETAVYEENAAAYGSGGIAARIIEFCAVPRSRQELAEHFGFDSSSYFVKRYVVPLVKEAKLKETVPGAPKSKNQRYVSSKL